MSVVNVPPDGHIYSLGRINGAINIYNTNQPAAPVTVYDITILGVGVLTGVNLLPGHTDAYQGAGTAVYVCNHGPSRIQVLYLPVETEALTPEAAGWSVVDRVPEAAGAPA